MAADLAFRAAATVTTLWLAAMTAACVLLALSSSRHARSWRKLFSSLLKHNVLPYRAARRLAQAVTTIQLSLACLIALALAFPTGSLTILAGSATALFFASMGAYLAIVALRDGTATCNCFGAEQSLNWFSVARAGLLAAGALGYLISSPAVSTGEGQILGVVAGAAIAVALLVVPNIKFAPHQGAV